MNLQSSLLILLSACTGSADKSSPAVEGTAVDSGNGTTTVPLIDVLDSLADNIGLAHFLSFQEQAAIMMSAATDFCANPTLEGLEQTRTAWWDTRKPWKHAEIIQFGPLTEYPERLGPKIDDWPVNAGAVDAKIEGDSALDLDAFSQMGTATRGLPVVEYLLWGLGEESLGQFIAVTRRCEMLVGAAQDVHANAGLLVHSWDVDWRDQLRGQADGDGLVMKDEKDVIDEWVNRLIFTPEFIRETKLGKPKGDKSDGSPQPDTLESRSSARSLQDALDVLAGIEHVWSGDLNGDHLGVKDLVQNDSALVSQMDNLFVVSQSRLSDIPETLEETIYSQPEIISRAQSALIELQRVLQSDVAANIGITVRFGHDGD